MEAVKGCQEEGGGEKVAEFRNNKGKARREQTLQR